MNTPLDELVKDLCPHRQQVAYAAYNVIRWARAFYGVGTDDVNEDAIKETFLTRAAIATPYRAAFRGFAEICGYGPSEQESALRRLTQCHEYLLKHSSDFGTVMKRSRNSDGLIQYQSVDAKQFNQEILAVHRRFCEMQIEKKLKQKD